MMDYIASLAARGLISPDVATGLLQRVNDLANDNGDQSQAPDVPQTPSKGVFMKGGVILPLADSLEELAKKLTVERNVRKQIKFGRDQIESGRKLLQGSKADQ